MASKADSNVEAFRFLAITKGVITVLFGIMALVWPGLTVATFAIILTIWLLSSGVVNIIRGIMGIGDGFSWIFTLIVALVQIGVGAYLIQRPQIAIATLIALVAISLVVEGVVSIIAPFVDNQTDSKGKGSAIFFGCLAVLAGIVIWRYPVNTTLAFVWVLGFFALISGPMWIALGISANKK